MVSTMMPHDFPALFALRDRRHSDRMVILECHALLEEEPRHWQHWEPPSRLIGIHPVSQSRDHGFWLTEHPPSPRHHPHITIVLTRSRGSNYNDYRFRLRSWVLTGDYVFTQRFPIPVPVLHLDTDGAGVESAIDDNFWFYTNHGSPVIRRDWYRYHNPRPIRRRSVSSDDSDTDESEAEPPRRARPTRDAQGAGHGTPAPKPVPPKEPEAIPAFVAAALATAAVSKGDTCPISMEPLATATAIGVTSCFHVFDASSIAIWLTTSGGGCCPVCKQRCVLTLPPSCDAQGAGHRDPKPATAPGNSPALVEL